MIREYHSDAKLAGYLHIDDDRLFEITAIQKKHLNHDIVHDSRLSDGEGWVIHVYFPEWKGLVNEENIALGNGQVGNNYDFDGYNEWMLFGNTNQDPIENDNDYNLDLLNKAVVEKWFK